MVASHSGDVGDPLSAEAHADVQSIVDAHPYLRWLGLTVEMLAPGSARLSVPYQNKLANPGGPQGLHGGVSSAVLDACGAVAIAITFDDPASILGQGSLSTTDLNVSYLRPATGDLIVAAEAIHVGSSKAVSRMRASGPVPDSESDHHDIVVGRGTYHLLERDD